MTDAVRCPRCGRPTRCDDPSTVIAKVHADYCISWMSGAGGRCDAAAAAYRRGLNDMLALAKENLDWDIPDEKVGGAWARVEDARDERLAALKES